MSVLTWLHHSSTIQNPSVPRTEKSQYHIQSERIFRYDKGVLTPQFPMLFSNRICGNICKRSQPQDLNNRDSRFFFDFTNSCFQRFFAVFPAARYELTLLNIRTSKNTKLIVLFFFDKISLKFEKALSYSSLFLPFLPFRYRQFINHCME